MTADSETTPFAFFHQNEGLLYQFFLSECVTSYQLIKSPSTENILERLMGDPAGRVSSFPGHLPKMLAFYQLQRTHFPDRPEMRSVAESLEHALDLGKEHLKQNEGAAQDLKKMLQSLKRELKKVGKSLLEQAPHYEDNPHVLYFILSHQEHLEEMVGHARLNQLVRSLKGGVSELETYLCDTLSAKGFHHLLPHIQKHLEVFHNG